MSQEKLTVNVLSTHLSANEIISTFDNQAIDENFVSNTFNGIFDLPINLETTPLFKDYVANVKKQLVKTKRQGRLQVARKSTNLIAVDIKQQKDKKEDSEKETKEEKEKDLSKQSSKATSDSIEAATLSPPETETTDSASIVPCEGVVDIEQQKYQDIKSEEKEKLKRKSSFDNTEHVSREKTIRNCSPPPESIKEEDKPC